MKRQRRTHRQTFKREAVEPDDHCTTAGPSLGARGAVIGGWQHPLADNTGPALPGNGKHAAEPPRIHELGTENRRRRMQQAPLKKATAFVGKQSP